MVVERNILHKRLRSVLFFGLASVPVLIFVLPFSYKYRHGIFIGEDWDYFSQLYEAARKSILEYHQFPWWNAWSMGGIPLFGNPQFGLFSIQTLLVLPLGTLKGLHVAIALYYLLGFWGMYSLLRHYRSDKIINTLLAYIWVFSGFAAWHVSVGHLTFAVYLLAPWVVLSLLTIHTNKFGWLWFGLWSSLVINTAAHYLTFELLLLCALIAGYKAFKFYKRRRPAITEFGKYLIPYLLSSLVIILLSGMRVIMTLHFTSSYPRYEPLDPPGTVSLLLAGLLSRTAINPGTLTTHPYYQWLEYGSYIGVITAALFCYLSIRRLLQYRQMHSSEWLLLVVIFISALIALGSFSIFSPFGVLHHLPIFNQMRVPSRFICWSVFAMIVFLDKLPAKKVIYVLLALSALDVFTANYKVLNVAQASFIEKTHTISAPFKQYEFFDTNPNVGKDQIYGLNTLRLFRATQSNIGEIYGYEPIFGAGEYYFSPGTNRRGENAGGAFINTNNAKVASWSPNRIVLKRTGGGKISLDMNPGYYWRVNGRLAFPNYRAVELKKDFEITDPAETIVLSYSPLP